MGSDHPRTAKEVQDKLNKQMGDLNRTSTSVKDNGDLILLHIEWRELLTSLLLQKTPGSWTD
jgi:hypothetical protein